MPEQEEGVHQVSREQSCGPGKPKQGTSFIFIQQVMLNKKKNSSVFALNIKRQKSKNHA